MFSAVCLLQAWLMWNFIIFQVRLFLYCGTPLTPVSTEKKENKSEALPFFTSYGTYQCWGSGFTSLSISSNSFLYLLKNKIIFIFVRFMVRQRTFFSCSFRFPGWKSESGINIPDSEHCSCIFDWVRTLITNKIQNFALHTGSSYSQISWSDFIVNTRYIRRKRYCNYEHSSNNSIVFLTVSERIKTYRNVVGAKIKICFLLVNGVSDPDS